MSEVELRLSQLREAAEVLSRSSLRMDASLTNVKTMLDQLVSMGFDDPRFVLEYSYQRGLMDKWSQQLLLFSTRLTDAANELEQALISRDSPAETITRADPYSSRSGGTSNGWWRLALLPLLAETQPAPSWTLEDYVSRINRPLYEELTRRRLALQNHKTRLEELLQTRQEKLDDLVALKNRLLSFDSQTDLDAIPRVQTLENEISHLDREILAARQNITQMQSGIEELVIRLDRVKPGAGADLRLIAGLENAEVSSLWVRNHTFGCVNHIVNRMPIPDGIPQHAYLWDQTSAQLTQYGITSGDVPLVGSVIVLEREHSYADDLYGHLLYVERVENGAVWVTDHLHPDTPLRLTDLTNEITGPNIHYLYFPWHTQA